MGNLPEAVGKTAIVYRNKMGAVVRHCRIGLLAGWLAGLLAG
jgi:hypothetical protein